MKFITILAQELGRGHVKVLVPLDKIDFIKDSQGGGYSVCIDPGLLEKYNLKYVATQTELKSLFNNADKIIDL